MAEYTDTNLLIADRTEKGCWHARVGITEENLKERAYYGPTGLMNFGGPVGEGKLESFVVQKDALTRLWALSEKETAINWPL
mgnify:CR=1 FL=1